MSIKYKNLLEILNESQFPDFHRGKIYSFVGTGHTKTQSELRHKDLTSDDWKDLHSKVEDHLHTIPKTEKKDGEYLFYSKSKDIGYVAHVNHKERKVHVITVLPKNRSNPKPGTSKVLVEIFLQ